MKRIVFIGHGRAGKDTACEYLATVTSLRNAGTCSKYLARYVAERLGVPVKEAYAKRHEQRELWFQIGNEVRAKDPAMFVREMMTAGELGGGIRSYVEFDAARAENLFDLAVWVENPAVPNDPTVKVYEEDCDVTIRNDGTLEEFRLKLSRLAAFAGLRNGGVK